MTKTAIIFAGQGAQVVGMGRDLADRFPEARTRFEQANQILGYNLARICFEGPESELTKTEHAQPGIFLVGIIAYDLLRHHVPSLTTSAAAGLSLGEFTALTAAGVFSFSDGLKVVRQRGQFMQEACEQTQGGMAAIIGLDETQTAAACAEAGVQIANLNCPGQIVISGAAGPLARAIELAKSRGARKAVALPVAGAYHSSLMAGAQERLGKTLETVPIQIPMMPVISNVTGQPHHAPPDIHRRLVDQVTSSVRWEDSMRYLLAEGFTRFIELGPGTALSGFMKRIDKSATVLNVADVPSLQNAVQALTAATP